MEWTEIHDTLLCREVLLEEPYKYKKGSNERGKKWTEIAEALNKSEEVKFKVAQRGVRERMERLQKKPLEKKKAEESASGIAVDDVTELETLIDEIIDRERLAAEESRDCDGALKKIEEDKQAAEKMRKEAMERFGETKKRSETEGEQRRQTKRRRSGNDAVEFLKEKTEKENEFRAEELALKKQHQQQEAARQGQILALMQQQQQQTAAMMALIERLVPKKS